jgi:pyruvate dehydrogenase E1 component alpha subunit
VEIQGARLPAVLRAQIDAEIDDLLEEARAFVDTSAEPDPAGALDYLYADGPRGRAGAI